MGCRDMFPTYLGVTRVFPLFKIILFLRRASIKKKKMMFLSFNNNILCRGETGVFFWYVFVFCLVVLVLQVQFNKGIYFYAICFGFFWLSPRSGDFHRKKARCRVKVAVKVPKRNTLFFLPVKFTCFSNYSHWLKLLNNYTFNI